MTRPTLHLLGIPHTVTREDFSHCAFTGKVLRFAPMMRAQGYRVVHYGAAGATVEADEHVEVMSTEEHLHLLGHPYHATGTGFYGDDAVEGTPLYRQFNYTARELLLERVQAGDIICFPFGHAHAPLSRLPWPTGVQLVETGIGYFDCLLPKRVYESYAVRHAVMAKEGRYGVTHESERREWVIPNYYRAEDWSAGNGGSDRVVFLGRICEAKGVDLIPKLAAARPDLTFTLCGQGDPSPYLTEPNVEYEPPKHGAAQVAQYLGSARAIIAPSRYVEPFCGVVVEAALTGTPAIASDFGAFAETIEHGVTGYRCQTFNEWVAALDAVTALDRSAIRQRARSRYTLQPVGQLYAKAFASLADAPTANVASA